MHETFWTLLHDAAHWEFEIFLMLLFDGVIVGVCWPFLRKHWKHHLDRDQIDDEVASTSSIPYNPYVTGSAIYENSAKTMTPPRLKTDNWIQF